MDDSSEGMRPEHPADRRIRELATSDTIRPDDRQMLLARISDADFYLGSVGTEPSIRGQYYFGRLIERREPSDFAHLVKRVLYDEEWAYGTTVEEYVEDLRGLARVPDVQVGAVSAIQGHAIVLFGRNTIPDRRRGANAKPYLLVIYATGPSSIISGYQTRSYETLKLPESTRWLP